MTYERPLKVHGLLILLSFKSNGGRTWLLTVADQHCPWLCFAAADMQPLYEMLPSMLGYWGAQGGINQSLQMNVRALWLLCLYLGSPIVSPIEPLQVDLEYKILVVEAPALTT